MNYELRAALRAIGSLWLGAVLLLLAMFAMACATVYEVQQGTPRTLETFYYSWWFMGLLAVMGVNILASLIARWPVTKATAGMFLTHVGILIVLLGAWTTYHWGITGRIGLREGGATDKFVARGRVALTLADAREEPVATMALPAPFTGQRPASGSPALVLEHAGVQFEVMRYLPDARPTVQVVDDDPQSQPAVQVTHGSDGELAPVWLFAGGSARVGGVEATFRSLSAEQFAAWRGDQAAQAAGEVGRLQVEVAGRPYLLSVTQCQQAAQPVGETGYTVKVLGYYPHAQVGAGGKLVSKSDEPVNPAVEVELTGPAGAEQRKAFANFPEFGAMHGEGEQAVKVVFLRKPAPIDVVQGPDEQLWVRFTPPGAEQAGAADPVALRVDEPVTSGWSAHRFTVLKQFQHARVDHGMEAIDPPRAPEDCNPALLVSARNEAGQRDIWVRMHEFVPVGAGGMKLLFADLLLPLEFKITLDRFHLGTYPGGRQPRSFESHVTIMEPGTGRELSRVISMNHPITVGRYTLYQSSYQMGMNGKAASFLSVAWDPGQPVIYAGYFITLLGMLVVLGMRMVSHASRLRQIGAERAESMAGARSAMLPAVLLAVVLGGAGGASAQTPAPAHPTTTSAPAAAAPSAEAPPPAKPGRKTLSPYVREHLPEAWESLDLSTLRRLPVQHAGRWPPVDTLARELVREVTGSQAYQGVDAVVLLLAWTFDMNTWMDVPLIDISNAELRVNLKLPEDREVYSYAYLALDQYLNEKRTEAHLAQRQGAKLDPLQKKVTTIWEKVLLLDNVFAGQAFGLVPDPNDNLAAWQPIALPRLGGPADTPEGRAWQKLGKAFKAGDADAFAAASTELEQALAKLPAAYRPPPEALARELHYNQLRPFTTAWQIMVVAAVIGLIGMFVRRGAFDVLTVLAMLAGWAVLSYGLYLRWHIAGRIPATNMYESLLFLSWGMGAFAILAMLVIRIRLVPFTASVMGALALAIADLVPGLDPFLRPAPPVLLDTIWMSIHVPIIMVSYSVLALAALFAHAQLFVLALLPRSLARKAGATVDVLHYWYIHVGSILLLAGIITGSMWASSSWGRYWGWDPKEVWSLIAFVGYLAILHVRVDKDRVQPWMYGVALVLMFAVFALVVPKLNLGTGAAWVALPAAAAAMTFFVLARGKFAEAMKSIIAFWMVVMTYVGVNFILGIGLHSYGFGTGAVAYWMFFLGGCDLALIAVLGLIYLLTRLGQDDDAAAQPHPGA